MDGGWFELIFIYNCSSLGFLNGQCFSFLRLRVTSKKSVCIMFAPIVIFKLCFWKSFIIFFLIRSVLGPLEFRRIAKPSSLRDDCRKFVQKNSPTSSHISAPS